MSQTEPSQEWPPSSSGVGDPQPSGEEQGGAERYAPEPAHAPEPASPYGAAPPAPYATPAHGSGASAPTSTIVLLVISGLLTLTGVGLLWAAPAVLAIVALVKHPTDPAGARRLARIGWWVAGALAVLTVLAVVAVAGLLLLVPAILTSVTTSGYTPSTVGLTTTALHALAAAARP